MPHGWRLLARSAVSPRACATDASSAIPSGIAGAFVDRTPIDWAALLERIHDPRGRAALEGLRRLDNLRGQPRHATVPLGGDLRIVVLRLLVVIGAVQTASGLARAALTIVGGGSIGLLAPRLLVTSAFAGASLLLASAAARDRRVLLLLAAFTFAATAFARAVLIGLGGDGSGVLFRGVFPEAFAPAALGQFAVLFPSVQRFARFDVWARRAAAAAWGLTACLFTANLVTAYGWLVGPLGFLGRDDPGNAFWYIFAATPVPAILAIFVRANRSSRAERERVGRLGYALAAGTAPFLLTGVARMGIPGVERWMLTGTGPARLAVDVTILGALAMMPFLATLAVIVDRPFELQTVVPPPLRRWFAATRMRLADFADTGSLRRRRCRERLTAALEHMRLAGSSGEIVDVLRRELPFGAGVRSLTVLEAEDLPADSAILAVLAASSVPIVFSEHSEPFALLPRREREWLDAHDVALASSIRLRDGSIAAVALSGPRRGGGVYDRIDRWFISTLLTGAAAAWGGWQTEADGEDEAFECEHCGVVAKTVPIPCGCDARAVRASLPRILSGKFEVSRRLGAGGMGVVYLARDTALGRHVALKTLPARRDESVARLRDEARAMAALNHPSLATIYGLEVWRRTPVLVVEYLAGGTLTGRLAHGLLPRAEVLALGLWLADALTYMHARGVLHRDLKPGNIGLTADGVMKLLDFGLSADWGTPAGTPAYLPPEALAGAPPDVAVDLWGLCTVLHDAGGRQYEEFNAFFSRAFAASRDDRFHSSVEIRGALIHLQRGWGRGPEHRSRRAR
jgi:tRNA A-37 threonylcarbamoyl transferase component Bud32